VAIDSSGSDGSIIDKDFHGFPVWELGLAVIGSIVAFVLIKHFTGKSSPSTITSTTATPTSGGSSASGSGSSGAITSSSPYGSSSNPSSVQSWINSAWNSVSAIGVNSTTAQTALENYLAGNKIPEGTGQASALRSILASIGEAPGIASPIYYTPTVSSVSSANGSGSTKTTSGSSSSTSSSGSTSTPVSNPNLPVTITSTSGSSSSSSKPASSIYSTTTSGTSTPVGYGANGYTPTEFQSQVNNGNQSAQSELQAAYASSNPNATQQALIAANLAQVEANRAAAVKNIS
jgi:mating pheromone-induced death protein 2